MKIRNSIGTVFVVIWVALFALTACSTPVSAQGGPATGFLNSAQSVVGRGFGSGPRVGERGSMNAGRAASDPVLAEIPVGELSDAEVQGLLYMREEEKLARDVYLVLYEQWGMQTFANIAGSEDAHMAAIKTLLDRYGLADPIEGNATGEFANGDLQALYDQLVNQGSQSLVDALKAGAAVEEIDIVDLQAYLAQTDKADIQRVYENLMRGSRNHLRAFVSGLERQGVQYERAYFSPEAYEEILNAETERGSRSGSPWGQGVTGGQSGRGRRGGRGR